MRTETPYDYGYQIPGPDFKKLMGMEGCCQREEDDEDYGGCQGRGVGVEMKGGRIIVCHV